MKNVTEKHMGISKDAFQKLSSKKEIPGKFGNFIFQENLGYVLVTFIYIAVIY